MLKTNDIGNQLKSLEYHLFCGVPCSFLSSLINYAINDCDYISATNEGDAIATCVGAHLSGRKSVMLMQNSGLGNAVSPLTSLVHTFKVPVLIFMSLRGDCDISDEPQHELMGSITLPLLSTMGIQHAILSHDAPTATAQIEKANQTVESGQSFCFVVKKGTFENETLKQNQNAIDQPILAHHLVQPKSIGTRTEALNEILKFEHCAILSTTGKTGRECFEINDSANQFYQIGSMGCVSAIGLGVSYAKPSVPVIVIDGDGAALMRLGSWATTGFYGPQNLCHILLDNGVHDSTGAQKTAGESVDFMGCAVAMNYPNVFAIHSIQELNKRIHDWQKKPTLTFLYVKIDPGSPAKLGRPTVTPPNVAIRFRNFIESNYD
ncbi:MAG: phosphonopyruvate decarboxylase [Candidatus Margulisiibacteriota bacterium]